VGFAFAVEAPIGVVTLTADTGDVITATARATAILAFAITVTAAAAVLTRTIATFAAAFAITAFAARAVTAAPPAAFPRFLARVAAAIVELRLAMSELFRPASFLLARPVAMAAFRTVMPVGLRAAAAAFVLVVVVVSRHFVPPLVGVHENNTVDYKPVPNIRFGNQ
jgi:hypothetical protein